MAKKIYVGNLSYHTTEDSLRNAFSQYGEVASVNVIVDRYTGSSKGFGFVEMATDQSATAAIAGLNSRELDGRQLRVNEANEKPARDNNRW
ncbi:MAG: RNA-binding protein [Spirochaetales bacterium]|jgi:RNA recognition motif-containing protein|nr:RNA-binding protein [Spirochaetales bacterium]